MKGEIDDLEAAQAAQQSLTLEEEVPETQEPEPEREQEKKPAPLTAESPKDLTSDEEPVRVTVFNNTDVPRVKQFEPIQTTVKPRPPATPGFCETCKQPLRPPREKKSLALIKKFEK